jgi:hypothetical protein
MGCGKDILYNGYVVPYCPVDYLPRSYGSITTPAGETASDSAEQLTS